MHLVQRGFGVRLVTASGLDTGGAWHERGARGRDRPLLESLAVLTETTHPHIDLRWLQESGHSGLLIAVLGDVSDHDRSVLTRMRHSASGAMAVVLDVPAWARGSSPGALSTAQHTAWLGSNGWRAVPAGPGTRCRPSGRTSGSPAAARVGRPTASAPTAPLTGSAS